MEKVRCAGAGANCRTRGATRRWCPVSGSPPTSSNSGTREKNHQRINASSQIKPKYHSPRNPSHSPTRCINEAFFFFELSPAPPLWLLHNAAAASIPPRALPSPSFLRIRATSLIPTIIPRRKMELEQPVPVSRGVRSQIPRAVTTSLQGIIFHHPQVTVHPRPRPRPRTRSLRYRLPATAFP